MKKIELIGEIGTNHNGKIVEAIKLIEEAKKAGIDTIKFQIYEPEDIVSPLVETSFYGLDLQFKYWNDYIKERLITPKKWLVELIPFCRSINIDIIVTAHSVYGAQYCLDKGIERLKIASMDCTYYPFLKELAKYHVPILLSTGMSNKYEIMKAAEIFLEQNVDLTLFHCTATYPTKSEEANMDFLNFIRSLNANRIGLSDHSENNDLVIMSIPYGVTAIEKHITLNKNQEGPDHSFALDIKGMNNWVKKVNEITSAVGSEKKVFSNRELQNRLKYLRKPILKCDLKKGSVLKEEDIYFARPNIICNDILDIESYSHFIGLKVTSDIAAHNVLRKKYFQDE
jgi:sialic acid synthase SpsE